MKAYVVTISGRSVELVIKPGETLIIQCKEQLPETEKPEGTPLKELDLPKIFYRRLKIKGYETVEQLCQKTERQLLVHKLIGRKCISLVKEALAKKGLGLSEV